MPHRAKARRKEQNRIAYLQRKPLPVYPERYTPYAVGEISPPDKSAIFRDFVAGRDTLSFDTYTLTTDHLNEMLGCPPYPVCEKMTEQWDTISAAVHGFAVASYLQTMDALGRDMRHESAGRILARLLAHHHDQEASADRLLSFIQAASASPVPSNVLTNVLAFQNFLWEARLVRFGVEDLHALRDSGLSGLTVAIAERRFRMGRPDA